MKKILLYFTIAMCLGFTSQKAMAAVENAADLCGKYSFTATQVSAAEGYESAFPTSFDVEIIENVNVPGGVIISGFAGSTNEMSAVVDVTAKTLTVESMPAYGADNAVVFSNATGDYPYDYQNGYVSLVFSFDDEKKLTLGAYSVVTVDHKTASATILASFKDAVGVAVSGGEVTGTVNFAGTYKATATCYNFETKVEENSYSFDIVIENGTETGSYVVKSIAGYEDAYMVNATAEGDVLTINCDYNYLTEGQVYDALGDNDYAATMPKGTITITYADGEYKMSDFSVWTVTWATDGTTYAYKLYISNIVISEGPEQNGGETPIETIDYSGTWKIAIDKSSCYSFDTTYEYPAESNFTMEKQDDGTYLIKSFLNSPDPYGGIYATPAEDNQSLVIGNLGYAMLSAGEKSYHLMDESATIDGTITLTNAGNNTLTVHDFYIGSTDYTDWKNPVVEKAVYIWGQAVTITKVTSAVENIAVDTDAPVEYYNMQGVKVVNPENGIFIKRQGGKSVKVVL